MRTNRAFHAWGHQFLWNREILTRALHACGFSAPEWCRYGESARPVFQGLERHETYGDTPELPHVLIAEAVKEEARPDAFAELNRWLGTELLAHLAG
ncbi:MAG: hypothetical protein HC793_04670 [Aquincola sp.]|nr:hypothetical protein [Aquincola sp.]